MTTAINKTSKAQQLVDKGIKHAALEWARYNRPNTQDHSCERGHFGCAAKEGGACMNELAALTGWGLDLHND